MFNGKKTRLLIGGSRSIYDPRELITAFKIVFHTEDWLASKDQIGMVISGGAKGVDKLGETFARRNRIDLLICPADWNPEGSVKLAVTKAECGIVLWDGNSRGTQLLIEEFGRQSKPLYIHYAVPTAIYKDLEIEDFLAGGKGYAGQ